MKDKELGDICLWLGRHQAAGTGLWVYIRAVLPRLLEELDGKVSSVEVVGAGQPALEREVETVCMGYPNVRLRWHSDFLGFRHAGLLRDLFFRSGNGALVHGMSNTVPLSSRSKRLFVTLHDLLQPFPSDPPKSLYGRTRNQFYQWYYQKLIASTDRIFTGHEKTAREIHERYGESVQVQVVYPPLTEDYFESPTTKLKRENYILAFVSRDPRKNFSRLFDAFQTLGIEPQLKLVVVVGHEENAAAIRKMMSRAPHGDRVYMVVRPRKERLLQLYRAARGTVFPSLGEGFGYPIYESLSQGTPVLTAAGLLAQPFTAAKEMLIECNPREVDSIGRGIEKLLALSPKEETVSAINQELRAQLHPEVSAKAIVEGYLLGACQTTR